MEDLDVEDLKQEAICSACVGESFLSRQIKSEGEKRICRYCRKKAVSFTLEKIAGIVKLAFLSVCPTMGLSERSKSDSPCFVRNKEDADGLDSLHPRRS